jgi:hypothetical protein
MIELPDHPTREQLVEVVGVLMRPAELEDAEMDQIIDYVGRHVPDSAWANLIYWPDRHPIARARGITEPTAAEVIEIAFETGPIALGGGEA